MIGPGPAETKINVQERILIAAEEVFSACGFAGTRISEIAVKAEVNQALIHYYFESKEKLYEAVLVSLFRQWEEYVNKLSWSGMNAPEFLATYIRAQFRLKCQIPNLYRIFHWEAMEEGDLFTKYASSTWYEDFLKHTEMILDWQQEGALDAGMNRKALLFLLWGMMNQFYFRSEDNLREIVGGEGDLESLQDRVADQMIRLTLHGVVPALYGGGNKEADPKWRETDFIYSVGSASVEEGSECADMCLWLQDSLRQPLLAWEEERDTSGGRAEKLVFVFASTLYGEMPPPIVSWLEDLRNNPNVEEVTVGIWVERGSAGSEALQRLLEDAVNRIGAYAVARTADISPLNYAKRCLKWAGLRG
ncbi:TetR/AcrR family transcriptional regulator [Paenibacillus sp. GCM10012306]|uniref:TetR/AcrR family transcriptional regulator n=1 Tax=Paenibacillus sp. GCM10012306 TaxID=3317342 RepID=UPI003607AE46